ncbi:MAG: hypothetical protein COA79_22240 [Planctomycetota bacterium]|nr:MAG: hypothetical protein COA79_22240 [Planctomycetota bacterium]
MKYLPIISFVLIFLFTSCTLVEVKPGVPETPPWANESGNDKYGLFAILKYEKSKIKFRYIPKGSFVMGNEKAKGGSSTPNRIVILTRGFWICESEMPQKFFKSVTEVNPSKYQNLEKPLENITYYKCVEFTKKLNNLYLTKGFNLPSVAQWEYSARGPINKYKDMKNNEIAWFGQSNSDSFMIKHNKKFGTHIIKRKTPNHFGLYDMLGNVGEWCLDDFQKLSNTNVTDPVITVKKKWLTPHKVYRGGIFNSGDYSISPGYRTECTPKWRGRYVGFRLVWQTPSAQIKAQSLNIKR